MMDRITRDQMFKEFLTTLAKRSTCLKSRVAALIVMDGRIISTGYNGSPKSMKHCLEVGCQIKNNACIRTLHAETNAIAFAARYGIKTDGSVMYTSISPCLNCAKIIINSGITEVVFMEEYRKPEGTKLLIEAGIKLRKLEK
jgi:dCMP deaminase